MLSLVVLISGGGSNLRALLEATQQAGFPARVVAVGGDLAAQGFAHAEDFGIPTFTVAWSDYPDRERWGDALLERLEALAPDLVILSGFMRLLPPRVVSALGRRVLNTHPAYLPAFPGAHAVRDALTAGVTQTGASVILVDDGIDSGPVIAQEVVAILPGDTEETLHERIKLVERRLLAQTVLDIAHGSLDLQELT